MIDPPRWHTPRLVSVHCDDCGAVRLAHPAGPAACRRCGSAVVAEATGVCARDLEPWPCTAMLRRPDEAILAWGEEDWGCMAAAEILLGSRLREKVLPTYLTWSPYAFGARPDWDALAAAVDAGEEHLSGSERLLLQLAANLAHGDTGAGAGLSLTRLWSLDLRHRTVVLRALTDTLATLR